MDEDSNSDKKNLKHHFFPFIFIYIHMCTYRYIFKWSIFQLSFRWFHLRIIFHIRFLKTNDIYIYSGHLVDIRITIASIYNVSGTECEVGGRRIARLASVETDNENFARVLHRISYYQDFTVSRPHTSRTKKCKLLGE